MNIQHHPSELLTKREFEVATRLAQGLRSREVADELSISIKTVDTHRSKALKKLSVRNNVELAHLMIARGAIAVVSR